MGIAVLALTIMKKGAEEIPGLTDDSLPRRLGPKRASNIRKLFNLEKKDDVRNFVVRREVGKYKRSRAPKIQRLITPRLLQRKRTIRGKIRKHKVKAQKLKQDYMKRL